MIFFTLILSLVLGLTVPASFTTSPVTTANVTPEKKSVSAEQIVWSPERRLSWEDFEATPDSSITHHAMTAANLAVDAKCNGTNFNYSVRCVFLKRESWSKNKQSEKLLQHEQMHFDLTEVHARLLRKKLKILGSSCTNVQSNLNVTVNAAFKAWKIDQHKFDNASKHGLDSKATKVWAIAIDKKLKQLEHYR